MKLMTNREWLCSMGDKELARLINKSDSCDYCIHSINVDCDSAYCQSNEYCEEGIIKWLNAKHEKPMPKIIAGDSIFYEYNNMVYRAFCICDNLVYSIDGDVCITFDDEIKQRTVAIKRYSITKEAMEEIWRADR